MDEFTYEELEVELLPTREALNWWGSHSTAWISATNVALAQNAGTLWSSASATATQSISVYQ